MPYTQRHNCEDTPSGYQPPNLAPFDLARYRWLSIDGAQAEPDTAAAFDLNRAIRATLQGHKTGDDAA